MKKYTFQIIHSNIPGLIMTCDIIPSGSLSKAIEKWSRKNDAEAPAYWDEPFFDQTIELDFTAHGGRITCKITW